MTNGISQKTGSEYEISERKRPVEERPRTSDSRSDFERDRSRIIHSAAFRRLQGKTQVFGLGGSDFFRTRLTHSLEVAQIGKGIALQCKHADPDLVEAVCLAHDLGHPPFGHAGEEELQDRMKESGGFEANAQSLRILKDLEVKSEKYGGLNLTRATIDGILKYKKSFSAAKAAGEKKFFYDEDADTVRDASQGNEQHSFECEIMDWADEIAYSVHDLEDGIKAGMVTKELNEDKAFLDKVKGAFERSGRKFDYEDMSYVCSRIDAAFFLKGGIDPSRREQFRKAGRKTIMANLIDYFIHSTEFTFHDNRNPTRYKYSLAIPEEVRNRCYLLKQIVWEAIINDERIATLERKAKTIVGALFEEFTAWSKPSTRELFPSDFRERLDRTTTIAEKTRFACDYIAGMTDTHAFRVYSRLKQPELTSIFDIL